MVCDVNVESLFITKTVEPQLVYSCRNPEVTFV